MSNLSSTRLKLLRQGVCDADIAVKTAETLEDTSRAISQLLDTLGKTRIQVALEWTHAKYGSFDLPEQTLFDLARRSPERGIAQQAQVYRLLAGWYPNATTRIAQRSCRRVIAELDTLGVSATLVQLLYMQSIVGLSTLTSNEYLLVYEMMGKGWSNTGIDEVVGPEVRERGRAILAHELNLNTVKALFHYHERFPPTIEDKVKAERFFRPASEEQLAMAAALTRYYRQRPVRGEGRVFDAVAQALGYAKHSTASTRMRELCGLNGMPLKPKLIARHHLVLNSAS